MHSVYNYSGFVDLIAMPEAKASARTPAAEPQAPPVAPEPAVPPESPPQPGKGET